MCADLPVNGHLATSRLSQSRRSQKMISNQGWLAEPKKKLDRAFDRGPGTLSSSPLVASEAVVISLVTLITLRGHGALKHRNVRSVVWTGRTLAAPLEPSCDSSHPTFQRI